MKSLTLKTNRDFRRVYNRGKSVLMPSIVLYKLPTKYPVIRIGFTVSNKIGNAVTRNRIRRRLREAFRLNEERIKPGFDLVIVARHKSAEADYRILETELIDALSSLGLIKTEL